MLIFPICLSQRSSAHKVLEYENHVLYLSSVVYLLIFNHLLTVILIYWNKYSNLKNCIVTHEELLASEQKKMSGCSCKKRYEIEK